MSLSYSSPLLRSKLHHRCCAGLLLIAAATLGLSGCDDSPQSQHIPDTTIRTAQEPVTAAQLPLSGYRDVLFTMPRKDIEAKYKCTVYEFSLNCQMPTKEDKEFVWFNFNEAGRMIYIKKELGYFDEKKSAPLLSQLDKMYGLSFEPTPKQVEDYFTGVKSSKNYMFAKGQVSFQIARSMNKTNQLMLIFYFPPDVGREMLSNLQNQ
jgi:hypothetical protein